MIISFLSMWYFPYNIQHKNETDLRKSFPHSKSSICTCKSDGNLWTACIHLRKLR